MTVIKAIISTLDVIGVIVALAATRKEDDAVKMIGMTYAALMSITIYLIWV